MTTLAEWRQFVTNVPEAQREYRTIEIYHPNLDQIYRFVKNTFDIAATLEAGAPWNPTETPVFRGVALDITEPAEQEDATQTLAVKFGNVDSTIQDILEQVQGSGYFTPVSVVYRKYYSSTLDRPAVPPLYLSAATVAYNGPRSVSFVAEDADLSQKRSGEVYDGEHFPGLRQ